MHQFGPTKLIRAFQVLGAATTVILAGCIYGFTGGGLPSHVKTIAIVPFDNETPVTDVQREVSDSLRSRLQNRLGLRDAAASRANAIVRGTIRRYVVDLPVGYAANTKTPTSARRQLDMVLDIDVIDQVTGKTLWSRKAFLVQGQYDEGHEARGRSEAIDRVVSAIVEGVQSQW